MRYILIFFIIFLLACAGKKHDKHVENTDVYYTCSMDPQIVEDKPGKCPICKMPLTAVKNQKRKMKMNYSSATNKFN